MRSILIFVGCTSIKRYFTTSIWQLHSSFVNSRLTLPIWICFLLCASTQKSFPSCCGMWSWLTYLWSRCLMLRMINLVSRSHIFCHYSTAKSIILGFEKWIRKRCTTVVVVLIIRFAQRFSFVGLNPISLVFTTRSLMSHSSFKFMVLIGK